ncbi:MAG: hypothetical protein J6I73_04150 [Treponema sp.]|nr:hypothetical protein [Treponema sp.]
MKHIVEIICAVALLASCTTVKMQEAFAGRSNAPVNYTVKVNSVSVTENNMSDAECAHHMQEILKMKFAAREFDKYRGGIQTKSVVSDIAEDVVAVDVVITQRAFIKNIEEWNSIYMASTLTNRQGSVVAQFGLCKETKSTIVSSIEQNALANELYKKILKFVKNSLEY